MIGSTQYSIIRTPFCPNADLWLFGLSGPEVQIIKNNVERSLQRNGCLGSKVLTLLIVLKVSMILYAFLQLAAPLPICTWQHLGVSRWQSLALLHVSCVIVFVHDATTLRDGCVLPRIMLYGDMVYYIMLYSIIVSKILLCSTRLCYTISGYVLLDYIILHYAILYLIISYHIMLHYLMPYSILL